MRLIAALLLVAASASCFATDRNAATCSIADVTTAYTAAVDGDRVLIPGGACTWNATLTVAKGIAVLAAGEGNGSGGTTNIVGARFSVTVPNGKNWSIGGFTTSGTAGIDVTGNSKSGRIHHITWSTVTGAATAGRIIWIQPSSGFSIGLVDHNTFNSPQSIQFHVREENSGNATYMRPLDLGGPDAWYVEDSAFNHTVLNISAPVTDCEGARFVFRHNTVSTSYIEMHDAVTDGLRGCHKWEIYSNTFTTVDIGLCTYIGIRGGAGVVGDNVFTILPSCAPILFQLYRRNHAPGGVWALCSSSTGKACLATKSGNLVSCTTDANCGGVTGACQLIDGTGSPSGYPCRDQLGTDGNAPQFIAPVLVWNNKTAANVQQPPDNDSSYGGGTYMVEGRDFCVGPTTSSADDATKPTSCAGKATPYTPYTYPHPLQGGNVAPKTPTNLAAN